MERLPGFRDFYPEPIPGSDVWSCDARQHVFASWRRTAKRYAFHEYDGPPLEPLELYTQKSGAEIVAQLFNFVDKGDRAVAMRPEMTPTVARMVATSERHYKKPIRWFAIPQLFRYEKQQKGRLREHFQLNCDVFGEADPAADAEMVALLVDTLRDLGLTAEDFVVRLSSRTAWQRFFESKNSDASRAYDFYQIVDKLEREPEDVARQKLGALGFTLEEVQAFVARSEPTSELAQVLSNLHARGLSDYVKVDYGIIRGLAYYTGIVFEAFDRKGEFRAIAGGGRYDNLIHQVSGGKSSMPALGFGMGDVVLLELLKARKKLPNLQSGIDAVVLIEDEALRLDSLKLVQTLREAGACVEYSLTPAKSDRQFKRALEIHAKWTVRCEGSPGNVLVRAKNLQTRAETQGTAPEILRALGLKEVAGGA